MRLLLSHLKVSRKIDICDVPLAIELLVSIVEHEVVLNS